MLLVNRRARLISVVALGAALIFPVQAQQAKLPKILSDPATAAANPLPDFSYARSEEHTSELQSLMRISYAVFCLKKKNITRKTYTDPINRYNIKKHIQYTKNH